MRRFLYTSGVILLSFAFSDFTAEAGTGKMPLSPAGAQANAARDTVR
mgnify:FL=1